MEACGGHLIWKTGRRSHAQVKQPPSFFRIGEERVPCQFGAECHVTVGSESWADWREVGLGQGNSVSYDRTQRERERERGRNTPRSLEAVLQQVLVNSVYSLLNRL